MKSNKNIPVRLGVLGSKERLEIVNAVKAGDSFGDKWMEKIRRFCCLYGRNLRCEAFARFGNETEEHLYWMKAVLVASRQRSMIYMNAKLYLSDALRDKKFSKSIKENVKRRIKELIKQSQHERTSIDTFEESISAEKWFSEVEFSQSAVLFCPTDFSLYSLSIFRLCLDLNIPIKMIVIRKMTLKRFSLEFKRDGIKLFRKIWRKAILRSNENKETTAVSLKSVYDHLNVGSRSVKALARSHGINFVEVNDFDEFDLGHSCDYGLFTGGGLVTEKVLSSFPGGILNVHMGNLPSFKGMDVVEATILDGLFNQVGLTCHLMSKKIDEGDNVNKILLFSDEYKSIGALRNEMTALSPLLLLDSYLGLCSGRLSPVKTTEKGNHHNPIHPVLRKSLKQLMEARHRVDFKNSLPRKIVDATLAYLE